MPRRPKSVVTLRRAAVGTQKVDYAVQSLIGRRLITLCAFFPYNISVSWEGQSSIGETDRIRTHRMESQAEVIAEGGQALQCSMRGSDGGFRRHLTGNAQATS